MLVTKALDKNLKFLVVEVIKQVESAMRILERPDEAAVGRFQNRDDYIDHLKSLIENEDFSQLVGHKDLDKKTIDTLRSLNVIAANLEHVADYAVGVVKQTSHFHDRNFLRRYDCNPFFDNVLTALRSIVDAFGENDTAKAMEICRTEVQLDRLYKAKFERIMAEVATGHNVPDLITSLFIFHYLERMGDALQNIGEAIIFAKMGEKLKYHQYQSLTETLAAAREEVDPLRGFALEGIWGTHSGCRVGKVSDSNGTVPKLEMIYKEGNREKIRKEKESIEHWTRLKPGLVPRVVEYQEGDRDATLLVEHLDGVTLQDIVLQGEAAVVRETICTVQATIEEIWLKTKEQGSVTPSFLRQLKDRVDDVYALHPEFKDGGVQIGGLRLPSFPDLLEKNLYLDVELKAPFSVCGHGDFNLDNVLYDTETHDVHFIDLHRSRAMDYVQDVSVFLVSIFRLPVLARPVRDRLNQVTLSFYEFARQFARQNADATFEVRLALGLVRSLVTSTRFKLEDPFAQEMFQRAVYLLQRVDALGGRYLEQFVVPTEVLTY